MHWFTFTTIRRQQQPCSSVRHNVVDNFNILSSQVGYDESTAIQKLDNFGKHYFALVHGTSDENVHFLV